MHSCKLVPEQIVEFFTADTLPVRLMRWQGQPFGPARSLLFYLPAAHEQEDCRDYHNKEQDIHHRGIDLPLQEKYHEEEGKDDRYAFQSERNY